MKYLFEMIGLSPVAADGETSEEEPGLARLVLDRMNLSEPANEEEAAAAEPVSSNSVE
jgi:hypothetical protein